MITNGEGQSSSVDHTSLSRFAKQPGRDLDTPWAMESMEKEWRLCLDGCLERRIPKNVFAAVVAQLHAKSPLPGRRIATLLLRPRAAGVFSVDPRIIVYTEQLLESKKINAADLLISTFRYSKDRLPKTGAASKDVQWHNPPELEETFFHRLHKSFATEQRPLTSNEGISTLMIITRWMQALVTSHTSDTMLQAMSGIQQQPQQQSINVREGLGMLVVGIIENSKMLRILNHRKGKGMFQTAGKFNRVTALLPYTEFCQSFELVLRNPYRHSYHSYLITRLDLRDPCNLPIDWRCHKNSMTFTRGFRLYTVEETKILALVLQHYISTQPWTSL